MKGPFSTARTIPEGNRISRAFAKEGSKIDEYSN